MIVLTPMYEDLYLRETTPVAVDVSTQDATSIDVKKGGRQRKRKRLQRGRK